MQKKNNRFKFENMVEIPTIPEFYRNKIIFITGGSGFIGKVLIEKLLRSCPDLKTIYLLMRGKKGQTPEERIHTITDLPLFDLLKSQNPDALNKIKIVVGDVRELDLGLNLQDQRMLIDEVNIVFHGAASVRFDDSLTDSVILNTRGTREIVKIALIMKNLEVLVHISTTFCNTDRKVVEEKFYPANADWEKTIEIAENIDRHTLDILTEKYIHPQPNTYTFAKSLSEHVVFDMCNGKIPVVIYRPSVVVHTASEPIPGWIDNFNGPVGLVVGMGKGVVRTVIGDPNIITDYIPVDITVKTIIICSWKQATYKDTNQRLTISFYNGSNNAINNITLSQSISINIDIVRWKKPFNTVIWYPNIGITNNSYIYFIRMVFYQVFPALLIDGLLKLIGNKPRLVKIQRKIHIASLALAYFSQNEWKFINNTGYYIKNSLLSEDVDSFSYDLEKIDAYDFNKHAVEGAKKYLLNEGEGFAEAKKHMWRMWILAQIVNFLWYLGLFWILIVKLDFVSAYYNY